MESSTAKEKYINLVPAQFEAAFLHPGRDSHSPGFLPTNTSLELSLGDNLLCQSGADREITFTRAGANLVHFGCKNPLGRAEQSCNGSPRKTRTAILLWGKHSPPKQTSSYSLASHGLTFPSRAATLIRNLTDMSSI